MAAVVPLGGAGLPAVLADAVAGARRGVSLPLGVAGRMTSELRLAALLRANAGQPLSHDILIARLWPGEEYHRPHAVHHLRELAHRIRTGNAWEGIIATVPGGYVWVV